MPLFENIKSLVKNNPYAIKQAALGATQLGGNIAGMSQGRNFNPQQPTEEQDAYGRPSYNIGQFATDVNNFKPQGASAGQILSGAGEGAAAGSAFGLPGAAVGAVVGGLGTAIGGAFGKSQEEEAKRKQEGLLSQAQQRYNTGMQNYNQGYLGRQAYEDQLKMYNLPTNYV